MAKNDYVFAVTRAHVNEQNLLSAQDLEQLIAAPGVADAFRLLSDKGWGTPDLPPQDPDALIAYEIDRTWGLIGELVNDLSPFNVFRLANDFHNLKAAIKLAYSGDDENEQGQYFIKYGTVPVETIIKAANEHEFAPLPDAMAKAGRDAYEALAHTGNGQACDMVIDRAVLVAIDNAGKKSESQLLQRYAQLTVDSANIKAAVRCCMMGKSREFIERAVAPAGTLNTKALMDAAASSLQDIYSYLEHTAYAGAVEALKISVAAFERWCDNKMIELIRPQRHHYFSIEPLAAFILGRENEIRMVRLILTAKINNLDAGMLRERLRETYV
ncbi:MAG: V-type ATPase subunit [Ruminococcaceae bacterium]|nr:V-type ATPase subunit [Oscillospiraceae bacterium]